MPYQWRKKIDERGRAPPPFLRYRGLKFPAWDGLLTQDELRSNCSYFAYFGGVKLTNKSIQYRVDQMIEQGLYQFEAA